MPISATITFAGGQILTAAQCNTGWSTPIEDASGRNGPIEREGSWLVLSGPDGDRWIGVPSGTTAERPTGARGMIRYNTTLAEFEYHNGTEWRNLIQAATVVTGANLNANGGLGTGASQAARGNHGH